MPTGSNLVRPAATAVALVCKGTESQQSVCKSGRGRGDEFRSGYAVVVCDDNILSLRNLQDLSKQDSYTI